MILCRLKRGWCVGVISIALLCCGCDAVYRILQKEGAEEKDLIGEIVPFESNPKVEEIQRLLNLYGYKVGAPDGQLGPNTRYAIRAFQEDNNLKVTRFVDNATWEALNAFNANGLVVEGEINVKTVQTALKNAGFNPGSIDGQWGPKTEENLRKFQKAMGLEPDGIIGFRTIKELADFLPQAQ